MRVNVIIRPYGVLPSGGDDVIARAAERYERKMAVVRGGRL